MYLFIPMYDNMLGRKDKSLTYSVFIFPAKHILFYRWSRVIELIIFLSWIPEVDCADKIQYGNNIIKLYLNCNDLLKTYNVCIISTTENQAVKFYHTFQ